MAAYIEACKNTTTRVFVGFRVIEHGIIFAAPGFYMLEYQLVSISLNLTSKVEVKTCLVTVV